MRTARRLPSLGSLSVALAVVIAVAPRAQAFDKDEFEAQIRPMVEKFCVSCHGVKRPKAGINLTKFKDETSIASNADLWLKISDVLEDRSMPPEGKSQPPEAERDRAVEFLSARLEAIEQLHDPGRNLIQRLTREQYNNTIRDLLGVDTRPADTFPADGGGGGGFDNNASTLFVPPILLEKYLGAATEVLEAADPKVWRVVSPTGPGTEDDAARLCVARFASRAFRRPVAHAEVERFMKLFRASWSRGRSFDESVKLVERSDANPKSDAPVRVSDFELASRLSYFLWSSMPDETLFDLATKGMLHEPEILDAQVKRMLADGKSRAFAQSFASQWLRVSILAISVEPDKGKFATYTPELREAMTEEPIAFFHAILKEDRPITDILGANYTYLNDKLAQHYGIEGVSGSDFRRVELTDPNRGGVLGMAAILTLTSYAQRTSPVLRGKWVLEELLGTPPPPPPPDVKVLPPGDAPRDNLTFRQRLEQHRSKPACAACHAKLDPLGFGLESFDPIGRWRSEIGGGPVDASGKLTTGETFVGPAELKEILVKQKKEPFVRNLTQRTLSYALRRGLEYYDGPTVKQIMAKVEEEKYRSSALIVEVVKSFPFQYRRSDPQK
jgi:Protein of unknown function (DUF1592)/Protein of unknown function (DUF1588)/Protein of unknown function (DUF1587)/Protein of unknown function (DUF1585)/Protein of unknown function (DUF1595)/Cytochrome C oxidase, cbb3-type, subunit III